MNYNLQLGVLWAELCPPPAPLHMLNIQPPVPQNVAVFGNRTFIV